MLCLCTRSIIGHFLSSLFRRPASSPRSRAGSGLLDFRITPLITVNESPRSANQLAADGATGLDANQVDVDDDDDIEVGFKHLGSVGECKQNFHCRGSEKCVRRRGKFK